MYKAGAAFSIEAKGKVFKFKSAAVLTPKAENDGN